jgi:Mycobacterium membrane protein
MIRRAWLPILIVVAIGAGGLAVSQLRTVFGAHPVVVTPIGAGTAEDTDPKVVTYEVFGSAGSAVINYLDLDGKPQSVKSGALPWSVTLTTTAAAASGTILAQSDGHTISCRIIVDDQVKEERTATGVNAETYCLVKSA